jgi:predicted NBD/HSP70 family sugar kinase
MYIIADIGGTHTRLAQTDLSTVTEATRFDTPQTYSEFLDLFVDHATRMRDGQELEGLCLGVPGVLTQQRSMIYRTPNLPGWDGANLKSDLQTRLSIHRVELQNDTALLGLGEALQPEMKDYGVIAFLGLGTGVGGVRIDGGKIDHAALGFEPGHQIIDYHNMQEWEALIGGGDIEKATGKKIADISDEAFWDARHDVLAAGVYNLILMWSPAAIVLGGGMVIKDSYRLELLQQKLNNINTLLPNLPPLFKTRLGDQAGLFGAMYYLQQNV